VPNQEATQDTTDGLSQIASQISCLYPPASGISILLTLPNGQTLLTGYQPLDQGQPIDITRFSYQLIEQP